MKKIVSFLKENKRTVLSFFAAAIFADILFFKKSSDLLIFAILALYLILIRLFKIKNRSTFLLCIALLIIMFINYIFTGASIATEKAAVWLILFLIIGVIQQWRE